MLMQSQSVLSFFFNEKNFDIVQIQIISQKPHLPVPLESSAAQLQEQHKKDVSQWIHKTQSSCLLTKSTIS
jgi:hypothetical protein